MSDELFKLFATGDLEELKVKYASNPSAVTLIDGILLARAKEEVQAKAKADFVRAIDKLVAKLPHPEDIMNVYLAWREVEMPVGEPEEVKLPNGTVEMRTPVQKLSKWVVEVNKGFVVKAGATTTGTTKTSKRAITVYKRNGTNLELKGHYQSASKACEALKLIVGGDSATRVLARDGFITEPYDGTDYTS